MTEKITVELNRKEIEVELASPTYAEMQGLRKFKIGKLKEMKDLKKKLETNPEDLEQEDANKTLATLEEKETKMNEILLKCCTNGAIKTLVDFQTMSSDGVRKLHGWLEEKMGLGGAEKENFTKT